MYDILALLGVRSKRCKEGHLMDPSWKFCPVCLAPICGWLVVMSSEQKNRVYTLHEGRSKIGSGPDCEIVILLEGISRQHAMLVVQDGQFTISDLSSVNGTFVNNIPISRKEVIDGDIIKLGDVEFKIKCL